MRILYITAGAAGMFCGSCLRDNALASELIRQGHDVTLLPLYTPTRTDEANVSSDRIFFGGISVYLEQHSAFFRHTPRILDRVWDSELALKAAARRSISVDPQSLAELTISMLRGIDGHQRKEFFKLIDWLAEREAPEIINLPNALLISLAAPIRKALKRPVCVTLQGEDVFLNGLKEPFRSEALDLIRSSVDKVDAFISVSEFYADSMSEYLRIPRDKIHVVPLGINLEGHGANHRSHDDVFTVGYFARIAPEKGLHLLADAYTRLRERGELGDARLEAAGYLAPEHRQYLDEIEQRLRTAGLGEEFHYRGELDRERKIDFLRSIDIFSMPATYAEPKGLSVIEAMANGVPIVQPRWGAFPEMIQKTGGGVLFEPNDVSSLAEAILSLWKNSEVARDLGRRGAEGVTQHYAVSHMAARALEVYAEIIQRFAF
jgi:glycosyltransferase involved in cell wall biosynthesis